MQKMMTYSEANSVLESSLTPANRCLSKAVAIANDANPDLLTNFDNSRLVPASVVEKAAHAEVLHFFCDENGNNLGTDYTVNVPEGQGAFVVYTRILVNGQTPDISWFEQRNWSYDPVAESWYPDPESSIGDNFSYEGNMDSRGIFKHVIYANVAAGKFTPDNYYCSVRWSSSARSAGININDGCTIHLIVNPISHSDYGLSKTILFFGYKNISSSSKSLGYGESLTINGFGSNFTVTKLPKDSKTLVTDDHDTNTAEWISDFAIQGTKLIVYRIKRCTSPNEKQLFVDVYKISDGSKTLYLQVCDGLYRDEYVQPGQSGDGIYNADTVQTTKLDVSPDPTSSSSFFTMSDAGSGYCRIDTSSAGSYIIISNKNGWTCSTKARIVIKVPTTGQIAWRSDWFDTESEDDWDMSSKYHLSHNILNNSQIVSQINNAVSQGAHVYLEAETDPNNEPKYVRVVNIEPQS